jgi:GNAT superfamily N-acetyltransferase
MKKLTWIFILILIASGSIQIYGFTLLGRIRTDADLAFQYKYNWDLKDGEGWYAGYTEKMRAEGSYEIDFQGSHAVVTAQYSWTWSSYEYGYETDQDSLSETHTFVYDLTTGKYLQNTDQDFDSSNMNVWFHLPQGTAQNFYEILGKIYSNAGSSLFFLGKVMPLNGVKLTAEDNYLRDDVYGRFTSTFKSQYFFTGDGYLLGEIYDESNVGIGDSLNDAFTIHSEMYVTQSSYARPVAGFLFFVLYWLPLVIFGLIIISRDINQFKPKKLFLQTGPVTISNQINVDLPLLFESPYKELVPMYILKTSSQRGQIITASDGKGIQGIGLVENDGLMATFFGNFIPQMFEYSKVPNAFVDSMAGLTLKKIEKYITLKVNNLQQKEFIFDSHLIRPVTVAEIPAVMRLISSEDAGRPNENEAKWVKEAILTDLVVMAIANKDEPWIQRILTQISQKQFPSPEMIQNQVLLGVGFATPSGHTAWLYGLYVHPAFRNTGIGKQLVMARLSALKQMGITTAITEIGEWNAPALKLYQEFPSEKVGEIYFVGKQMPKVKVRRH